MHHVLHELDRLDATVKRHEHFRISCVWVMFLWCLMPRWFFFSAFGRYKVLINYNTCVPFRPAESWGGETHRSAARSTRRSRRRGTGWQAGRGVVVDRATEDDRWAQGRDGDGAVAEAEAEGAEVAAEESGEDFTQENTLRDVDRITAFLSPCTKEVEGSFASAGRGSIARRLVGIRSSDEAVGWRSRTLETCKKYRISDNNCFRDR